MPPLLQPLVWQGSAEQTGWLTTWHSGTYCTSITVCCTTCTQRTEFESPLCGHHTLYLVTGILPHTGRVSLTSLHSCRGTSCSTTSSTVV